MKSSTVIVIALMLLLTSACDRLLPGRIQGLNGAYFGSVVALHDNRLLITMENSHAAEKPEPAVALYRYAGEQWQLVHTFTDGAKTSAGAKHAFFGDAIALTDDMVVIGAWGSGMAAPVAGSVFLFSKVQNSWQRDSLLINPDVQESQLLGKSVTMNRTVLVAGAPGANRNIRGGSGRVPRWSGAVHVWQNTATGWRHAARLIPDEQRALAAKPESDKAYYLATNFGEHVALDDEVLVVSAQENTATPGKVYIFTRNDDGWRQQTRLQQPQNTFGISIALDNGWLAVAASESIYLYRLRNGSWQLDTRLQPDAGEDDSGFQHGGDLALHGNTLVAGAIRFEERRGAAYVFEYRQGQWLQTAMLSADDTRSDRLWRGAAGDMFGRSVAVYDNTIAVGAPFHDAAGDNNGAVYLFTRTDDGWVSQTKLVVQP